MSTETKTALPKDIVDYIKECRAQERGESYLIAVLQKVQTKLDNPQFTQKVPANVLEEHRKRLADWQAKEQQILNGLANLQA